MKFEKAARKLEEILECPKCHSTLIKKEKQFMCTKCKSSFSVESRIPKLAIKNKKESFDTEKYYNEIYSENVNISELKATKKILPFKSIRESIVKKLIEKNRGGGVLLSIGCGIGEYEELFMGKKYILLGTDLSLNALKVAKNYCKECQYFQARAESLPLKNSSVDIVLCIDMIEHVINDKPVLKEISRVLKKEGLLVITTVFSYKHENFSYKYENAQVKDILLRKDSFGEGGDLRLYGYEFQEQLKKFGLYAEERIFFGGDLMQQLRKLKNYFLSLKKHERIDVISGRVLKKNPHYYIYSKILKFFYWIDYLIYCKRRGELILLLCRKVK